VRALALVPAPAGLLLAKGLTLLLLLCSPPPPAGAARVRSTAAVLQRTDDALGSAVSARARACRFTR
jgi:hypothetical protein